MVLECLVKPECHVHKHRKFFQSKIASNVHLNSFVYKISCVIGKVFEDDEKFILTVEG